MDTRPQPAITRPSQPYAAAAYATLAYLAAEVAYLTARGQLCRLDDADEARARGEQLPSGSTVAGIRRKAAAMLRCPPSALPHPPLASR
jgi:hypothetical protein